MLNAVDHKAWLQELNHIFTFVKSSFAKHVGRDECAYHNVNFGLGHPDTATAAVQCTSCSAVQRWFSKLASAVPEKHRALVHQAAKKVHLYMGHAVRTRGQQQRIDQLQQVMIDLAKNKSEVLWIYIIVDYKMKILPGYWREVRACV